MPCQNPRDETLCSTVSCGPVAQKLPVMLGKWWWRKHTVHTPLISINTTTIHHSNESALVAFETNPNIATPVQPPGLASCAVLQSFPQPPSVPAVTSVTTSSRKQHSQRLTRHMDKHTRIPRPKGCQFKAAASSFTNVMVCASSSATCQLSGSCLDAILLESQPENQLLISHWPLWDANSMAVARFSIAVSPSTPDSSRDWTIARRPSWAAICNGGKPLCAAWFFSAPTLSSKRTMSIRPCATAMCNGVAPLSILGWSLPAPTSTKNRTTSRWPISAAKCVGVTPWSVVDWSLLAPASTKHRTISRWPTSVAKRNWCGPIVSCGLILVYSNFNQKANCIEMTTLSRMMQWCFPIFCRLLISVNTDFQQEAHSIKIAIGSCKVYWCCSTGCCFLCICTCLKQQPHRFNMSFFRSLVQRCKATFPCHIRISRALEQLLKYS